MVILCFRQVRLAFRANNWLTSVSGREDLALRANKFGLSSVSGREDLALRANNWLTSVSGREG